ncbi:hypothetical protein CJ739_3168 [Mariniflexile rhizosphaerae]|nr:hypothetical protein CJ739_3168 [Mariniflexile sp. TRM1-10]
MVHNDRNGSTQKVVVEQLNQKSKIVNRQSLIN